MLNRSARSRTRSFPANLVAQLSAGHVSVVQSLKITYAFAARECACVRVCVCRRVLWYVKCNAACRNDAILNLIKCHSCTNTTVSALTANVQSTRARFPTTHTHTHAASSNLMAAAAATAPTPSSPVSPNTCIPVGCYQPATPPNAPGRWPTIALGAMLMMTVSINTVTVELVVYWK